MLPSFSSSRSSARRPRRRHSLGLRISVVSLGLVLIGGLTLVPAAPAVADVTASRTRSDGVNARPRWPKKNLKIYIKWPKPWNPKGFQFFNDAAMAMMNLNMQLILNGTGWSFELVLDPADADITMYESGHLSSGTLAAAGPSEQESRPGGDYVTTSGVVLVSPNAAGRGWEQPGDSAAVRRQKFNRQKVMAHELLHLLGLDDVSSANSADVMYPDPDPANDQAWACSPHDIQEAKDAAEQCSLVSTTAQPSWAMVNGPSVPVEIRESGGGDFDLEAAVAVTFTPSDPTHLWVTPGTLSWGGKTIDLEINAGPDAWPMESYTIQVDYQSGASREYGGFIFVQDHAPAPGALPHAVVPADVLRPKEGQPVLLDGTGSYHDDPAAPLTVMWEIDGRSWATYDNPLLVMEPGVNHLRHQVRDGWGRFDSREVTAIVGWTAWEVEEVGPGGALPHLRVGSDGDLHVAHGDFATGMVYYSRRDGDQWETEPIALAAVSNQFVTLGLTPADQPQIVFYDANLGSAFFAERTGMRSWYIEPIPGLSGGDHGDFCRMATDQAGMPHVVFLDSDLQVLVYARYVPGPGWIVEHLDTIGTANPWPAIGFNVHGVPVVTYRVWEQVRYAERQENGWQIELVAGDGRVHALDTADLSFDSWGVPTVAYQGNDGLMRIARRSGGLWTFVSATLGGDAGGTMMACPVCGAGYPTAFYPGGGTPGNPGLVSATMVGDSWQMQAVDPAVGGFVTGTSAVYGKNHTLSVGYMATTAGPAPYVLRVATQRQTESGRHSLSEGP